MSKRKILYKECAVAGWNFHEPDDFWDELYEGAELRLVREPNNEHDRYAVAVALPDDYDEAHPDDFDFDFIIGYVPRTDNQLIAQMMDMGWNDVFTACLSTVKEHGTFDQRLRMTIYVQSHEDDTDETPNIHPQYVNDVQLLELTDALRQQGFVDYRWGGFPPDEYDLPKEGDNVLFIHRNEQQVRLYLMHVIATDEHTMPYLKTTEYVVTIDDCSPYVLTNIMGPLMLDKQQIAFLSEECIDNNQPCTTLSPLAARRLTQLLNVHYE